MPQDDMMEIRAEVPAGDYVLITKSELGKLVEMLRKYDENAPGLWDAFQALDIRARSVKYRNPKIHALIGQLTGPQKRALQFMAQGDPDVLYDENHRILGMPGLSRRTLNVLVKHGLATFEKVDREMMKGPFKYKDGHRTSFKITDFGREVAGLLGDLS